MRTSRVILGTIGVLSTWQTAAVSQNQQYRSSGSSSIGGLRAVGTVGNSNVISRFGRVGGGHTSTGPSSREDLLGPRRRGSSSSRASQMQRIQELSTGARIGSSNFEFGRTPPRHARRRSSGIVDPFWTRLKRIREQLPPGLTSTGPLRDPALRLTTRVDTPARVALRQRNLLRPKSELSQLSRVSIMPEVRALSAQDELLEPPDSSDAEYQLESDNDGAPAVSPYEDQLKRSLRRQEADYYAKGVEYFRQGKLRQAAASFSSCKTLDGANARFYVANLVVDYERGNNNSAVIHLLKALRHAETLEDLRIVVEDAPSTGAKGFYLRDDRGSMFANTVDRANVSANLATGDGAGYAHLLLAFFAWLNGEVSTAIHAAELAEKSLSAVEHVAIATKFRELLIDERITAIPGSPNIK